MDVYRETERDFGLTLVTGPASEPVALDEAAEYVRSDEIEDTGVLARLIPSARRMAEKYTGRAIGTQTWKLTLWQFPCGPYGAIDVPKPPLQSASGITYVDNAGVTRTVDPATYIVDPSAHPGRISLAFGQYWPYARFQAASVQVTYVAGFMPVPDDLCTAILMQVADWFDHRVPESEMSPAVKSILDLNWAGAISGGF